MKKRNAMFCKLLLSLQRKIQKLIIMIQEFTSLYWQSADAAKCAKPLWEG